MTWLRSSCLGLCALVTLVAVVLQLLSQGPEYQTTFEGYAAADANGSWPSVSALPLAELTRQRLRDNFVYRRRPLLITGVSVPFWSWDRLAAICPDMALDFRNHFYEPLKAVNDIGPLRMFFDWQLRSTFGSNVTLKSIISAMTQEWTISTFLSYVRQVRPPKSYRRISDYFWPLTVHSVDLDRGTCDKFIRDVFESNLDFLTMLYDKPGVIMHQLGQLFVAPDSSRAYPMHQHGQLNENFLLVLSGAKRIWVFPPNVEAAMDERPEFQFNEYADRIFMAEPVGGIRGAEGAEVIVRAGEAVFLPAGTIHLVENIGDVIAVAFHLHPHDTCNIGDNWTSYIEERGKPPTSGNGKSDKYATLHRPSHHRSWLSRLVVSILSGSAIRDALRSA